MSDFLSTQRHPAFRNSLLQKLQQPILKLRRCPHSVAATSQLCLLSRKSLSSIETRSLPALTRSHPRHFYLDHSHCPVLAPATLAALPSTRAIETRLLPSSLAAIHHGFAFYVAFPKRSIPSLATCSMLLIPSAPFAPSVFSAFSRARPIAPANALTLDKHSNELGPSLIHRKPLMMRARLTIFSWA